MRQQPKVVLVAEDDVLIREVVVDMLTAAGFEVLSVENAAAAVAVLDAQANRIDTLFTDIRMPGSMDGMALAHHTRQRWPNITVLITSGHVRPRAGDLPERSWFIPKPYSLADLVNGIWQFGKNARRSPKSKAPWICHTTFDGEMRS